MHRDQETTHEPNDDRLHDALSLLVHLVVDGAAPPEAWRPTGASRPDERTESAGRWPPSPTQTRPRDGAIPVASWRTLPGGASAPDLWRTLRAAIRGSLSSARDPKLYEHAVTGVGHHIRRRAADHAGLADVEGELQVLGVSPNGSATITSVNGK